MGHVETPVVEALVARQAIFDRERRLYGYELLYRSDPWVNAFDGTEAAAATMNVLSNALLSIGGDGLLAGKKAFVNFDESLLASNMHLILSRECLVIEVLETVEPTDELVQLCRSIREQGYTLALDDFVDAPRFEPLTRLATVIKVDVRQTSRERQERLLETYKPRGILMLAEKVESYAEFDWARHAGYDLFQGYFFARPEVVQRKQIPAVKTACIRLLREVQQPELDFGKLERLIRQDVSLAYKLLRYANSAKFPRREPAQSLTEALLMLGEDEIRRWVALATLPKLATNKPGELLTLALVRARFCEQLSALAQIGRPNDAFLMGMFSVLDALVDRPLDEALSSVRLGPELTQALLGTAPDGDGMANLHRLIMAYEAGQWEQVEQLSRECRVTVAAVGKTYLASTAWAERLLHPAATRLIG
jgi:c-di-GMP-related signal transduction protein